MMRGHRQGPGAVKIPFYGSQVLVGLGFRDGEPVRVRIEKSLPLYTASTGLVRVRGTRYHGYVPCTRELVWVGTRSTTREPSTTP